MQTTYNEDFLRLYEPIHPSFTKFCSAKAIGWMETEDLMQETILATLKSFPLIQDKSNLLGYMVGVAKNLLHKHRRKAKFTGAWDDRILEKLTARTTDPAVALDLQYLIKAIDALPPTQAEAIELFELSGFSIQEVANIQQCSTGAVKTRISRGRKQLRTLLRDENSPLSVTQRLAIYASFLL